MVAGEGSLHLSADEYRDYHRLLQRARDALAPHGDMSEAVIDSALWKAHGVAGVHALNRNRPATKVISHRVDETELLLLVNGVFCPNTLCKTLDVLIAE